MRPRRSWIGVVGTLALAGLPAPAGAQPVGSEFQINSYTTGNQTTAFGRPLVASDASGNEVFVWTSRFGQDGSSAGIFGQRYDSAGETLGTEFRVNSYTTNSQLGPCIGSDASGNFVVVWTSDEQDGDERGVFGQRYDSAGERLGGEFRVNSYTTFSQHSPCVAVDASGNFVVVWESYYQDGGTAGVFGQRYDSAGKTLGTEFRVNSYTTDEQRFPAVASDASGNFVVVWMSRFQDGNNYGIFGQRYDNAGETLGIEFRVNSYTDSQQRFPSVASDPTGNFVVVWESIYQDGNAFGVFGQRFDSAGVPQGDEFQVNSWTPFNQTDASVSSDPSGNFVVVWNSIGQDGDSFGAFGQRYDNAGVARGNEFQINSFTTDAQAFPSVRTTGANQFVVAWTSIDQDGDYGGVFGRRFDFAGEHSVTVVSPNTDVKWRIGSLQKIQWTHNLGHRATFRIELDRDDDGTFEELITAAAPADSTRGTFAWTVTGPPSGTARMRVSWTDDLSVSDASDVTFQIRPAGLGAK